MGLAEYSISQSTLEDVFLKFAAEQEKAEEGALQETAEASKRDMEEGAGGGIREVLTLHGGGKHGLATDPMSNPHGTMTSTV